MKPRDRHSLRSLAACYQAPPPPPESASLPMQWARYAGERCVTAPPEGERMQWRECDSLAPL